MSDRIASLVRPAVQAMSAYHVADASHMVKLDAMENPYTLPDELQALWQNKLANVSMNRYPDPSAEQLKETMRVKLEIPDSANFILGNGSDEIIQMLALALGGEGRSFFSVEPAFVMYRMIAAMNGLAYESVDLDTDTFALSMDTTLDAIEKHQPSVVFIANPNNPTGNIHSLDELRQIAQACPGLLIIDEAYAPFTDMTAEVLMSEFAHVLVMRTVSKMGLAGLRLGYIMGAPAWIEELDKVRLPYNINVLTQVAAEFALQHKSVFDEQAQTIRRHRSDLLNALEAFDGIRVWPSEANFLLLRVLEQDASAVFDALKDRGVLIKNLTAAHDNLKNCLRVTVGTEDENQQFLDALRASLAA